MVALRCIISYIYCKYFVLTVEAVIGLAMAQFRRAAIAQFRRARALRYLDDYLIAPGRISVISCSRVVPGILRSMHVDGSQNLAASVPPLSSLCGPGVLLLPRSSFDKIL